MHKQYYNQLPTNLTEIHIQNINKYTLVIYIIDK